MSEENTEKIEKAPENERADQNRRETAAFTFFHDNETVLGIIVTYITATAFAFSKLWWFALIAGLLGGVFHKKSVKAVLYGGLTVALGWFTFVLIELIATNVNILLDQLGVFILGDTGMGTVLILIVVLVGFIFGMLGGYMGYLLSQMAFRDQ